MELHYLTPAIRTATTDGKVARTMFGEDLARSFQSLIADIRDAMYLAEVPGEPVVQEGDGKVRLNYPLGVSAVLEIEPIGTSDVDGRNWGNVHRVKLLRILDNGKVLA